MPSCGWALPPFTSTRCRCIMETISSVVAIVHDFGYISGESLRIWRETFLSALAHVVLIVVITLLIVRWSITGPIARVAHWMKALRTGRDIRRNQMPDLEAVPPARRAKWLRWPRASMLRVRRRRWKPVAGGGESHLDCRPPGGTCASSCPKTASLFVVSNREPYVHLRQGKVGGVQRARQRPGDCARTGAARLRGDVDRAWQRRGRRRNRSTRTIACAVPPDDPHYTLRRVWLTKEEEEGYYYGFANEGLSGRFCHIAHTRPVFRAGDWEHIRRSIANLPPPCWKKWRAPSEPIVLVQDYHFALLPRMIKERPRRTPASPSSGTFRGPIRRPSASARGSASCSTACWAPTSSASTFRRIATTFLADRGPRAGIAHRVGALCGQPPRPHHHGAAVSHQRGTGSPSECRGALPHRAAAALLRDLGVEAGAHRPGGRPLDYTKGIPERFRGIERFLEKYPAYQERFTFVQIGAPSRTRIKRYQDLAAKCEEEAERINRRFRDRDGSRSSSRNGTTATPRSGPTTAPPTSAW